MSSSDPCKWRISKGDTDTGGIDSCQGDSGGPIVIRNGNEHVQVGVVSFGIGCADRDYPGVYAKVGAVYDWIQGVVCDDWGEEAAFCDNGGGSIDITVTGGTGNYTYDWADVAGTNNSEDRVALAEGNYSLTVIDDNGCTAQISGLTVSNICNESDGEH